MAQWLVHPTDKEEAVGSIPGFFLLKTFFPLQRNVLPRHAEGFLLSVRATN